jgi:hypothetical protein
VVHTASDGNFVAPALPPGHYSMLIAQPGFKQLDRHSITLQVDQTVNLDLVLAVGSVAETIDVPRQQQVIDTETMEASKCL